MNSNQLGLAGLGCIVLAVAMLAGLWWAMLAAGVLLVVLAYVAHRWEQAVPVLKTADDVTMDELERRFREQTQSHAGPMILP